MWIIFLIIILSVLFFYVYNTRNKNYWTKRGVPHEKPVFIFGNLKDVILGKIHLGSLFTDIYKKYKNDKYVGFFKLNTPGLVIRDPELVKQILVKDFNHFENNDFEIDPHLDPIISQNIFFQTGEEWKKSRASWTAGLTMSKIKATHDIMYEKANSMIKFYKSFILNNKNQPIDAREIASNFFIDVIVGSIFGLDDDYSDKKNIIFKKIVNSFFQPSFLDNLKVLSYVLVPRLSKFLRLRWVSTSVSEELKKIANDVLENRQKTKFQKNNSLDSILFDETRNKELQEYTVAGLVLNFLIDGSETSAGFSSFILYTLAANPHIQSKLREEVNNAAEESGGKIAYDEIQKLQYLDMIFNETLRLYPPGIVLTRLCTKDYELPPSNPKAKSIKIKAGMSINIPIYGLQTDPEYFTDPEKFNPERFNAENKSNIKKFTFMPFGEGPRSCVGFRFATNQVKILIAVVVNNFEIRLAPQMIGKPITIDPNVLLFRNLGGIWITLHDLKD